MVALYVKVSNWLSLNPSTIFIDIVAEGDSMDLLAMSKGCHVLGRRQIRQTKQLRSCCHWVRCVALAVKGDAEEAPKFVK